jgi:serine/threonine protein kinase
MKLHDFKLDGKLKVPGISLVAEVPYLVMEFIEGGMLYDLSTKTGIPEDICLYMFRQIL